MPKYTKKKINDVLKRNKQKTKTKSKARVRGTQMSNDGNIIIIDQSKRTNPRQPTQPKRPQPVYIPPIYSPPPPVPMPSTQFQESNDFKTAKLLDGLGNISSKLEQYKDNTQNQIKDTLTQSFQDMNKSANTYLNNAFTSGANLIQSSIDSRFNHYGNYINNSIEQRIADQIRELYPQKEKKPPKIKRVEINLESPQKKPEPLQETEEEPSDTFYYSDVFNASPDFVRESLFTPKKETNPITSKLSFYQKSAERIRKMIGLKDEETTNTQETPNPQQQQQPQQPPPQPQPQQPQQETPKLTRAVLRKRILEERPHLVNLNRIVESMITKELKKEAKKNKANKNKK